MKKFLALLTLCALCVTPAFAQTSAVGNGGPGGVGGFMPLPPQGRLTLTSGAPVMTADVANASSIYYSWYNGNLVPIYNGTSWTEYTFTNNLQLTVAAANVLSTKVYDVYASIQSGAVALCTGPAWTNGTTRSSAIALINGIWTNNAAMSGTCFSNTTGYTVALNQGTYLGSIYANANAAVTWNIQPTAAAHGSNNFLGVYNAYNRVHVTSRELTSTTSNTYATNTWHAADGTGQTLNIVTFIDGLGQSPVRARVQGSVTPTASDTCQYGINLNSTSATPNIIGIVTAPATAFAAPINADGVFLPTLGLNVVNPVENSLSAATCTFNATATYFGLTVDLDD